MNALGIVLHTTTPISNVERIETWRQKKYEIDLMLDAACEYVREFAPTGTDPALIDEACEVAAKAVVTHYGQDRDPIEMGIQAATLWLGMRGVEI